MATEDPFHSWRRAGTRKHGLGPCIPRHMSKGMFSGGSRPCSARRVAPCPHAPRLRPGRRIGEFWGNPRTRTFAELLIDCEEDRMLRAVVVGILREAER